MNDQPSPPWRVRLKTAEDIPSILALARTLAGWFQPLDQMTLAIDLKKHKGIVVEQQAEIVAFLTYFMVEEGVAELSWLAVSIDRQGRGLGTLLLATLEQALFANGVQQVRLNTIPADANPAFEATNAFYRRHGFEVHSRTENFYSQGRPGLQLIKHLTVEAIP